jgi:hypothetical protein
MSLILLQRSIGCMYPLFSEAENYWVKELALVSNSFTNVLKVKQIACSLASQSTPIKSSF